MRAYILRRLILAVPTVIGATLLVFVLMAATPGGIGGSLRGDGDSGLVSSTASAAARREYLNERYGLESPVLVQYGRWLAGVLPVKFGGPLGVVGVGGPDLGRSMQNDRPVVTILAERVPVSLGLNVAALLVVCLIAIPSGALAGLRAGGWWDRLSSAAWLLLWSVPIVWAGAMVLHLLAGQSAVFAGWWGESGGRAVFPIGGIRSSDAGEWASFWPGSDAGGRWRRGLALDTLWHVCLPVVCLAYADIAILARMTRSATVDGAGADHVRTAVAKGLSPGAVARRHVLRPSLVAIITLLASSMGGLIAGSVIVESVFDLPGMGRLVMEAIQAGDRELLLGTVLLLTVLNVGAMLIADVLYARLDPRVELR